MTFDNDRQYFIVFDVIRW